MTEPKARLLLQLAAEECSTIHDRSEAEVMKAFKMEKFMTEAKLRSWKYLKWENDRAGTLRGC